MQSYGDELSEWSQTEKATCYFNNLAFYKRQRCQVLEGNKKGWIDGAQRIVRLLYMNTKMMDTCCHTFVYNS